MPVQPDGSAARAADEGPDLLFRKSTDFKLLTPNDKLATYGIDDPLIDGVACYYTAHEKGGIAGMFGVAEQTSDVSLACNQYGPIKLRAGKDVYCEQPLGVSTSEARAMHALAKQAGVEKIDAGPKGGTVAFRGNQFANPMKLIQFINQHSGTMKVRPDQKIVVSRDWPTPDDRLKGAKALLGQLAKLAA